MNTEVCSLYRSKVRRKIGRRHIHMLCRQKHKTKQYHFARQPCQLLRRKVHWDAAHACTQLLLTDRKEAARKMRSGEQADHIAHGFARQ